MYHISIPAPRTEQSVFHVTYIVTHPVRFLGGFQSHRKRTTKNEKKEALCINTIVNYVMVKVSTRATLESSEVGIQLYNIVHYGLIDKLKIFKKRTDSDRTSIFYEHRK